MQVRQTELSGVFIIEPQVFADARGYFKETYHKDRYARAGLSAEFVQDNFSKSRKGTLRGLHYQIQHPQGKLIQVFRGAIFDVAVDLRRDSPTFGKWTGLELSETNHLQLYVPPGFAHGFCVVSDEVEMFYKCTDLYFPEHERTLLWNDADVNVNWPVDGEPVLSGKDRHGLPLSEIEYFETSPE